MPQTFSHNKKIYSVDMMFAYLNIFDHPAQKIIVSEYLSVLEHKGWGDPAKKIFYSPMDVLNNSTKKMYSDEIKKIKNADLKYPIIIFNGYVVDGVHRLTKAYIEKEKYTNAYIFDNKLMKKFLINNNGDWDNVNNMQINDTIELFWKRFK